MNASRANTARPPTAEPTAIPAFAPVESCEPDEAPALSLPLETVRAEVVVTGGRVEVIEEVPMTMTEGACKERVNYEAS